MLCTATIEHYNFGIGLPECATLVDLTVSETLAQAFERASALDAPLSGRLQFFAESVRAVSLPFAEAADRMIARLQQSGAGATAPKVGEEMPPFVLPDDHGHLVSLQMLLERGPVAVSFHRGHWCPYCRLNTSALAQAQCAVEPLGAQIVAITPDLQRFTGLLRPAEDKGRFPILTDIDNGYAMSLDLVIYVGQEMMAFMKESGWDIAPFQGNAAWMLPIPATFIIARDRRIAARFIDPDYRRRMAIEEIVEALQAL